MDSVSVFAEGTFEEQIEELVGYLARGHAEEERENFIAKFQAILRTEKSEEESAEPVELSEEEISKRRHVLSMVIADVKAFGEGSEKEIEGFYNLLFAHLRNLFPFDSPEMKSHLDSLLIAISSSQSHFNLQYRLLSLLFNSIPRQSGHRLSVYKVLLRLASSRDELEVLQPSRANVEKWTNEWDITPQQKSDFLKTLVGAFAKAEQPIISYQYLLAYLRSLPPSSPEASSTAVHAISTALRLPSIFDFDSLFKIDAIVNLGDHELFSLLRVFLSGGLDAYNAWYFKHAAAIEKYNLDKAQLERKIRLLSLTSLGFENIGRDLPYSTIATTLQVDPSEVEKWVIDVIRAGLLSGKLSQTTQLLHVTRSTSRVFEREQWEVLEQRLAAWRTGLGAVLDIVASAQQTTEILPTGDAGNNAITTATADTAVQTQPVSVAV